MKTKYFFWWIQKLNFAVVTKSMILYHPEEGGDIKQIMLDQWILILYQLNQN
jgi:hypothetical protein